jgi:hypothetical protein
MGCLLFCFDPYVLLQLIRSPLWIFAEFVAQAMKHLKQKGIFLLEIGEESPE